MLFSSITKLDLKIAENILVFKSQSKEIIVVLISNENELSSSNEKIANPLSKLIPESSSFIITFLVSLSIIAKKTGS